MAARLGFLVLLLAASVQAHHSIASIYDSRQARTLDAVVTRFQFTDPHPFIFVTVQDARGRAEAWKLEMDNRWELAELGFHQDKLKPGDRIVVQGNRARRDERSLYVRRLERPADGFTYQHHP